MLASSLKTACLNNARLLPTVSYSALAVSTMVLTNRELTQKQHRKIRELRQALRQLLSEHEHQAVICALYCWENLT